MRKGHLRGLLGAALLALPALANQALAEDEAMAAAGKAVFHQCEACHSLDTSKNSFGPSLYGVVGRKAASVPRFAYSKALTESGITWNEANLRKWISDNEGLVPGTRMRHVSITDPAEQDYLLAFLRSLK